MCRNKKKRIGKTQQIVLIFFALPVRKVYNLNLQFLVPDLTDNTDKNSETPIKVEALNEMILNPINKLEIKPDLIEAVNDKIAQQNLINLATTSNIEVDLDYNKNYILDNVKSTNDPIETNDNNAEETNSNMAPQVEPEKESKKPEEILTNPDASGLDTNNATPLVEISEEEIRGSEKEVTDLETNETNVNNATSQVEEVEGKEPTDLEVKNGIASTNNPISQLEESKEGNETVEEVSPVKEVDISIPDDEAIIVEEMSVVEEANIAKDLTIDEPILENSEIDKVGETVKDLITEAEETENEYKTPDEGSIILKVASAITEKESIIDQEKDSVEEVDEKKVVEEKFEIEVEETVPEIANEVKDSADIKAALILEELEDSDVINVISDVTETDNSLSIDPEDLNLIFIQEIGIESVELLNSLFNNEITEEAVHSDIKQSVNETDDVLDVLYISEVDESNLNSELNVLENSDKDDIRTFIYDLIQSICENEETENGK